MPVTMKPARDLRIGDVFSTDGYEIVGAVLLQGGAPDEVYVECRRADDPRAKIAYLAADALLPIWTEV